jgi:hypothetical protein
VLEGEERERTLALIAERLACRPALAPVRATRERGDHGASERATPASAVR